MDTKQRGEINWDVEIDVYALLHIKEITNDNCFPKWLNG